MASKAPSNQHTILRRQLAKALSTYEHPNLLLAVDEKDISKWCFLVSGLPTPFAGGEYIMEVVAREGYPIEPPEAFLKTKNGVFMPDTDICVSIGKYHADDKSADGAMGWRPAMGILGFAQEMVNGLLNYKELGHGIGLHIATEREIKAYAAASRRANAKHPLHDTFETIIATGPADKEPYKTLRNARGLP